ncbi:hypothetical protein [Nitrogeniibacter aestuarii]|uniref:hypothetical protein n=1 Tax=Nitrogeniibacter aestuarii TaxID=2815343 RepID=UPI001E543F95|nr:hypothetical protein [Nitrogeniibacter aestuarii]
MEFQPQPDVVVVLATDMHYPFDYISVGWLLGDQLTVETPFSSIDGILPEPEQEQEDQPTLELVCIRLADGKERQIGNLEIRQIPARTYLAVWDEEKHIDAGEQRVSLLFFSEDEGYSEEDRQTVAALDVGQTVSLVQGGHTVQRVR